MTQPWSRTTFASYADFVVTCRKGDQDVHFTFSDPNVQTVRSLRDAVRQSFSLGDGGILSVALRGMVLHDPQATLRAAGVAAGDLIMIEWAPGHTSPAPSSAA